MSMRVTLVALEEGYRESKESWLEVLRNLRERGHASTRARVGDRDFDGYQSGNIGSYHFVRSGKMRPNGLKSVLCDG
jgi:hypothetical protein